MFYDIFVELCAKKGVKPTRAALDMGLSKATPTLWKNKGYTPRGDIINKVAAYFGVSVDYLLGNEEKPAVAADDELNEILEDVRRNPELRAMFSITKKPHPNRCGSILK